jgi:hypothetical protein
MKTLFTALLSSFLVACASLPAGIRVQPGELEACAVQPKDNPCTVWSYPQLLRYYYHAHKAGRDEERAYRKGLTEGQGLIEGTDMSPELHEPADL